MTRAIKAFLIKRSISTDGGNNASVYCFQKGFNKFKQKMYTPIALRCFLIGLLFFLSSFSFDIIECFTGIII